MLRSLRHLPNMRNSESFPKPEAVVERTEKAALPAVINEALQEAAVERRHPFLERLARKLRIAATVCMLGLSAGAAAPERAEQIGEHEGRQVFTAETVPPEMPDAEIIVGALIQRSDTAQMTDSGQWDVSIPDTETHSPAVERWISIGRRIRAVALAEAQKLPSEAQEALTDPELKGIDAHSEVLASAGAAMSEAFEEATEGLEDDEDDPLMQFMGEATLTPWESMEPQERADALNKLVADARELGVVLTWEANEE